LGHYVIGYPISVGRLVTFVLGHGYKYSYSYLLTKCLNLLRSYTMVILVGIRRRELL